MTANSTGFLYDLETSDGTVIFSTHSAEGMRKAVCDCLEQNPAEFLIEVDNRRHPQSSFPYIAWTKHLGEVRGSMWPTKAQAIEAAKKELKRKS